MKILGVFNTNAILGGGEISFALSLQGLQDASHDVLAVVTAEGPLTEYLSARNIAWATAPQPTFRRGGSIQFLLRAHPALKEIAARFAPDVLHCNAIRSALYGQAVGRALSIPSILHARTAQSDPPFDQFLMATTAGIICTSEVVRRRFSGWFQSGPVEVIGNAIDPHFLKGDAAASRALRAAWLPNSKGTLIGVVGRLSPEKGQHHIVAAAPAVLQAEPLTRFVFIGDEDPSHVGYEQQLRSMLRNAGCENAFVFAGFQADMRAAYGAVDFVGFPTSSEGFGRVVIEAGALSRPVVATDLPVLHELMPAAVAAELLAKPDEFASRLNRLIQDRSVREDAGRKLHEHVRQHFTLEAHVHQLLRFYRQITTTKTI